MGRPVSSACFWALFRLLPQRNFTFAALAALAAASLSAGVLWAMETPETLNPKTAHNAKIKCLFIILVKCSSQISKNTPHRKKNQRLPPGRNASSPFHKMDRFQKKYCSFRLNRVIIRPHFQNARLAQW